MKRALQGRYLKVATAGESFKAFVPAPLPPRPAIEWSPVSASPSREARRTMTARESEGSRANYFDALLARLVAIGQSE